jgi:uncharacterized OB-fold protein
MPNDQLNNAQHDADGHPECGDEYCPGFPDCPACSQLRDQDWLRHETTSEAG